MALYGFRTALECAGKAVQFNRTPVECITTRGWREPGCRGPVAPRRRRFPPAATPVFKPPVSSRLRGL